MKKAKEFAKELEEKWDKKPKKHFFGRMIDQIRTDKKAFIVYLILRAIVIAVIVRSAIHGQWENVFTGALALLLFMLPPFVEKNFRITLPTTLEILVFCFVFCAEILGEIGCFYVKIPIWDTMLHTTNGFMFAAFGFSLVDIFNRRKSKKLRFELSPLYQAIVAFCFSMTIGVLWEFFEFSADMFLHTDMQKDFTTAIVSSVSFDTTKSNTPIVIKDIVDTIIVTKDGTRYALSDFGLTGYLDIGIIDTMKDLMVNFVGAVVFSFIGYFYVKKKGQGKIARQFIPVATEDPADAEADAATDERERAEGAGQTQKSAPEAVPVTCSVYDCEEPDRTDSDHV